MTRIFIYTFLLSSLLGLSARAQVKPVAPAARPADTSHPKVPVVVPVKDSSWYIPGGLRIGVDVSRVVNAIFYPYRKEITVVADARLNPRLYAAFEGGYATTPYSDSSYTYKGNGAFVTLGIDYNFLKRQYPSEKNMFFGGIRYGFSHFNYEIPTYTISNSYWGDKIKGSYPKTNANAHWIELVLGLKTEVLKNFFLGWNIRERILLNSVKTDEITPLTIPGFGRGNKRSVFDVQYTVSYVIPFYRIKEHYHAPDTKKKIPKR
ncbi:DUF6048 family protein [Chitinophaga vietnamensis]|uniref:DUF6048 family protein n=1 Tax=Chitinophaga vietnamensis TaxID=2593957 RepID=UPI001178BEB3|nr:DUF6048 family protein [Chitinophaga vietnamensis]